MESKKIKILAIDDNIDNLITLNVLIKEIFPEAIVLKALSGKQGLEIATLEEPHLILLDIIMPEMDGFDVCKILKVNKNIRDIPVIFVTALGTKEDRIKALESGGEGFLSKPIDESELTAQIRVMLKIRIATLEKRNENERLEGLVVERTKELIKAKEKAEESDQLKTEFINNMSHEIRTPMQGILGFSNFLNDENLSNEKRKNYVKIIENSGRQLLQIIDDILEISRLGTKQVILNDTKCNLNNLMFELFSVFNIKSKENKIPLYLDKGLRDEHCEILLDRVKLHKVLGNLLENAFKFTHSGQINFGYQINKGRIEFFVRDTGIGIKKEHLDTIFERFSQANKELSKKVGGLGLGLSIAKENVILLGGTLTVESELLVGSTFKFDIPFSQYDLDIPDKDSNEAIENSLTFLIVEDEEVNFMFIEILLLEKLKLKCRIIHAINGKEAVAYCKANEHIDLVLMDLKMPVMNGYEATRIIREFRPDLPIIAQTAYSSFEDKKEAKDAGCDDFLSKPITSEMLNNVIKTFLPKDKPQYILNYN
jgi:signal transduction histidine kinase